MSAADSGDPSRTADQPPAREPESPSGIARKETATFPPSGGTAECVDAVPDPGAPPLPSPPGYQIEAVLGRGGMGVVYKARHLALKRTVALKMVLAGPHAGPLERARFRREAESVARLQHPNIVQIHEVGEADGHPYRALEFVEGGTLAERVRGRPLPPREAARVVEVLARAVHVAHSRNVVHRDLKPANVLLAADGTPKVTDFGLARHLDGDGGHTQAGAVMGTPSYMAPEQAAGRSHEAGPAADVYALGAILDHCLTGRPPFLAGTAIETLDQVRTREPVPPSRGRPGLSPDLETICLKCLRKPPEQRYASAAELADELGRFARGEPIRARPVGRAARWARRHPASAALLAVSGVAALAVSPALSGGDGAVRVFDAGDGREAYLLQGPGRLGSPVFSPDGARIAAFGTGLLQVHDARTGEIVFSHTGMGWQTNPTFSGDGARLAWSHDGLLEVYDAATGRSALTLPAPERFAAPGCVFSPDGSCLAVRGTREVRIYHAPREPEAWQAERHRALLTGVPTWNRLQAVECERADRWFAAAFHWGRLTRAEPAGGLPHLHLGVALAHLGRAAEAGREFEAAPARKSLSG